MMPQASNRTQLTLHNSVLEPLKPYIPERKSLTQFVEDLLEKQLMNLDTSITLNVPSRQAPGPTKGGGSSKQEEETRAREELINRPPTPAPKAPKDPWSVKKVSPALVPDDLTQVAEKFVEWWAVRNKGAVRTESVAYRELNKLRAWKATDRAKALDKAIASGWKQLYEPQELKSFNTPQEAPSNHPAQKVFKASDLGPEWERANWPPSATGGKGVLEPGAF